MLRWLAMGDRGQLCRPQQRGIARNYEQMTNGEIEAITKQGGSKLTQKAREAALHAAAKTLKTELNVQLKSFAGLKVQHIDRLVQSWTKQGISQRSMQNRMTHIRAALRFHDRAKFALDERISNASLGLAGASRGGTHTVPAPAAINTRLMELTPPAHAVAQLQLALGLRAREAIQADQSLKVWAKQLASGRPISVLHGTKGGRPRDVLLHTPEARQRAVEAVQEALKVARSTPNERIIPSKTIEAAFRSYQREMNKVGFKGSEASHSLRYHWAREQFSVHLERLGDRKEALAALSMDLGHGDGRGRYCAQVYLKG